MHAHAWMVLGAVQRPHPPRRERKAPLRVRDGGGVAHVGRERGIVLIQPLVDQTLDDAVPVTPVEDAQPYNRAISRGGKCGDTALDLDFRLKRGDAVAWMVDH